MEGELERILAFVLEVDKLKSVHRRTLVSDRSRYENSAEHSWHLALMAVLLHPYAKERNIDVGRVVSMLLVHDIVEIDAGDTFAYDEAGHADKAEREQMAANRLFGLLPEAERSLFMALWHEFEAQETAESRFAMSLDRLQPMMLNAATEGAAWRKHGITSDRVLARNQVIETGSPALWAYARKLVRQAVADGSLEK